MKIHLPAHTQNLDFFLARDQFTQALSEQNKKIIAIAFVAIGCLAAFLLYWRCRSSSSQVAAKNPDQVVIIEPNSPDRKHAEAPKTSESPRQRSGPNPDGTNQAGFKNVGTEGPDHAQADVNKTAGIASEDDVVLPASPRFKPVARDIILSAKVLNPSSLYDQVRAKHPEDLEVTLAMLGIRSVEDIRDEEIFQVMGQYLNLECAIHEIVPGLFLGGGNYTPEDRHIYHFDGSVGRAPFDQVICATRDRPRGCFSADPGTSIHEVPSDPNRSPPDVTLESLRKNDQADLNAAIRVVDESLKNGRRTFVYCSQGKDRSASVVIGYLMSKYDVTYDQALAFVRSKRFIAEPSPSYATFFNEDFKKVNFDESQNP